MAARPQQQFERGSTPWHALQNLARRLHEMRDDPEKSAARAAGEIRVVLMNAAGVDPNGGWVAQADWLGPKG